MCFINKCEMLLPAHPCTTYFGNNHFASSRGSGCRVVGLVKSTVPFLDGAKGSLWEGWYLKEKLGDKRIF